MLLCKVKFIAALTVTSLLVCWMWMCRNSCYPDRTRNGWVESYEICQSRWSHALKSPLHKCNVTEIKAHMSCQLSEKKEDGDAVLSKMKQASPIDSDEVPLVDKYVRQVSALEEACQVVSIINVPRARARIQCCEELKDR
ncbi:hypothetical protein M5K25_018644 [Dendrobium thyrsiflorum]|uniref:Uncharacterized protein n=1 Tax=Dendrobium thyrsiflorum TaxID=117978 RepID=A0ABD0UIK8_DENTH